MDMAHNMRSVFICVLLFSCVHQSQPQSTELPDRPFWPAMERWCFVYYWYAQCERYRKQQ